METPPTVITALFAATTLFTIWQFYTASNKSKTFIISITLWLLLISILGIGGIYQKMDSTPPGFVFLVGPVLLVCILLPLTPQGRNFIDTLSIQKLTLLHVARLPVEITLYFMATAGLVPYLMTFDGYNLDILSGITAPFAYLMFTASKGKGVKWLLVWNIICFGLLLNILIIAIFAIPTPFQQWAFDQPNIGVARFPFVWLPGIIVPLVLFSHVASIIRLSKMIRNPNWGEAAIS